VKVLRNVLLDCGRVMAGMVVDDRWWDRGVTRNK